MPVTSNVQLTLRYRAMKIPRPFITVTGNETDLEFDIGAERSLYERGRLAYASAADPAIAGG
jgi:hypothetical protein